MRLKKIRIVPIVMGAILISCSSQKASIEKSIASELELHPQSQLVDIYKYLFQDVFGPGHLAPSAETALKYLDYELGKAEEYEEYYVQKMDYRGQFVRVNLSVIKDKLISKEEFHTRFMLSAQEFKVPEVKEWKAEWANILEVIESMELNLSGYIQDSLLIDSVLNSGSYVVHHSALYIEEYDPHYRLFHKEQLEGLNFSD